MLVSTALPRQTHLEKSGTKRPITEVHHIPQSDTVRYHLQALDLEDTCAYVEHRLGVAGWKGGKLFPAEALRLVHRQSRGVPRLINVLCDRALVVDTLSAHRDHSDL